MEGTGVSGGEGAVYGVGVHTFVLATVVVGSPPL
jgi:hypothetical protein